MNCKIEKCLNKHWGLGFCKKHYERYKRNGDANILIRREKNKGTLQEKFNKYLEIGKKDECWEWKGLIFCHGYGRLTHEGKSLKAHRISYLLYKGDIPKGLYVCHKCDNRKCINPNHLWLGTKHQNMVDCKNKLRHMHGSKNSHAKLTEQDVILIRKRLEKGSLVLDIANEYGLHKSTVFKIKSRRLWKFI